MTPLTIVVLAVITASCLVAIPTTLVTGSAIGPRGVHWRLSMWRLGAGVADVLLVYWYSAAPADRPEWPLILGALFTLIAWIGGVLTVRQVHRGWWQFALDSWLTGCGMVGVVWIVLVIRYQIDDTPVHVIALCALIFQVLALGLSPTVLPSQQPGGEWKTGLINGMSAVLMFGQLLLWLNFVIGWSTQTAVIVGAASVGLAYLGYALVPRLQLDHGRPRPLGSRLRVRMHLPVIVLFICGTVAVPTLSIYTWEGRYSAIVLTVITFGILILRQVLTLDDNVMLVRRLEQDVARRSELEERLTEQAFADPLTGLPNRAGVLAGLMESLADADAGGRRPGVLFVDLDGFKKVNDAGGHSDGDRVLEIAGRRLRRVAGSGCQVGRLGGDEFVVVVVDAAERDLVELGEQLIAAMQRRFRFGVTSYSISASVGIATYADGDDAESLLRKADLAVYEAKSRRGVCVQFDPEMIVRSKQRAETDDEIMIALDNNTLLMHYQPLIELATGRICGVEALLRWTDRSGALRGPQDMLAFAERSGGSAALTWAVLDMVTARAGQWHRDGFQLPVAFNLSPQELISPGLVDRIRSAMQRHRVPRGVLAVEITEQALMAASAGTAQVTAELRELGIGIAIDDFGTGYSSLQYLIDFPIEGIKIDRAFVKQLNDSAAARIIVSEIGRAARRLRVKVVAEGIETEAQLETLRKLGVAQGQGFLLSRAIDADQITAALIAERELLDTAGQQAGAAETAAPDELWRMTLRSGPDQPPSTSPETDSGSLSSGLSPASTIARQTAAMPTISQRPGI